MRATFAILGSAAIEGPVISWVADHRKHHAFSDAPGDPHSPHVDHGHGLKGALRGLLHAHVGWLFIHTQRGSHERYAPDLLADPTIRWVNKWFFAWAIGGLRRGVRARLADRRLPSHGSHGTAVGWGRAHARPAPRRPTRSTRCATSSGAASSTTKDESRNLLWLAIPSFGESWHNNHHAFPTSAEHGMRRWQIDTSAMVIRAAREAGPRLGRRARQPRTSGQARGRS